MAQVPRPRALGWLLAALLGLSIALPAPGSATATWSLNLFSSRAFMYQDPYGTTCTAAAVMIMLNTIADRDAGGPGLVWTPYRVKNNTADPDDDRDMVSIFRWERRHDTLRAKSRGSDAHGWRNALNYYGWGTWQDPSTRVYEDRGYRRFGRAVKSAVRAIARFRMPVGILGWAGGHAQVMHGYVVTGEDPAVSSNFTVVAVYLSDPLLGNSIVNRRVSIDRLRSGPLRLRFRRYLQTDSPKDDPYTGGWKRSSVKPSRASSEWYGRYVIIRPVRAGVPEPSPTPTPEPNPTPTPDETPGATPTASPTPTAAPTPTASPKASVLPSPTPVAPPTVDPSTEPTPSADSGSTDPSPSADAGGADPSPAPSG